MKLNDMFTFDQPEWEQGILKRSAGGSIGGGALLAMMESEEEDVLEDAFAFLKAENITIDLSDLPKTAGSGSVALRLRQEQQLVENGRLMQDLDREDLLRRCIQDIARIPDQGSEDELVSRLLSGTDTRERLVNLSMRRVVELAKEFVGRGVLMVDLIQEGSLGLWDGILDYNGGDFGTSRDGWIRRAMAQAIIRQARASGLGQKMRQAVEDYRMVDERLLAELGRNPTTEELAEQLHLTVEETEAVRKTLDNARMVGKAHTQPEPEEETAEDTQAVEDTAYYQTRERVDDLMSGLTELETKLLNLRYGLDGKPPVSAEEAGKRLNLTVSEVVELETTALAKMRSSGE